MARVDLGRFMYAVGGAADDLWEIRNKGSDGVLGYVDWYSRWKSYVFNSMGEAVIFSADCLEEIVKFLKRLNKERK